MILWLMGQYLRSPSVWGVSVLGAMVIVKWPVAGWSILVMLVSVQLRIVPGRPTVFDAALPISARDLVTARMFARLVLCAVPLLACAIAWRGEVANVWSVPRMLEFGAIATLALLIPHGVRPNVLGLSVTQAYVIPIAVLAVMAALVVWLLPATVGVALFGIVIVVWVTWTAATTPPAFARGDGTNTARAPAVPTESDRFAAPTHQSCAVQWLHASRPVWGSLMPWPLIVAVAFMILGGWTGSWLLYVILFSVLPPVYLRQRTAWLASLPLSHRVRLLTVAGPFCLSTLGGLAVGRALPKLGALDRDMGADAPASIFEGRKDYANLTRVPLTFWTAAGPARTPPNATNIGRQFEIVSPWGERVVADTISVLRRMYFNPYTTSPRSTPRMRAWQLGRATTAVYGRPLSVREYNDKSSPRPPRVTDTWSIQLLGGALTLTLLLYILLVYEIPLMARSNPTSSVVSTGSALALLFLPTYIFGGICLYTMHKRGGSLAVPMIERALLAMTRTLPDNLLVVGIIAAIPPSLLYLLLERQFSRSEIVRLPAARR